MCNQVVLKKSDAVSLRWAEVAVAPHRCVAAFIIKSPHAALVWRICEQSERK